MLCGFAAGEMPDLNQASTTQSMTDEGRNRKFLLYNLTCYFLVTKKVTKEVPLAHAGAFYCNSHADYFRQIESIVIA